MGKICEESHLQQAIVRWAKYSGGVNKELALLYAIPNGAHVGSSNRMRLVAEGLKKGMPDLCLPVPRGNYGSLFLEVKTKTGTVQKEQREIHKLLEDHGNRVRVVRDLFQAIDALEAYLNQPP